MSNTIVQEKYKSPLYSLHDSHLEKFVVNDTSVYLHFQYGYTKTTAPYEQVNGDVEITGLDWQCCCVYVMEYTGVLCGNYGNFMGKKMTFEDFQITYKDGTIDVIDEMYGYNQVKISGFLNFGGKCYEVQLEFYYNGEFRYILKG